MDGKLRDAGRGDATWPGTTQVDVRGQRSGVAFAGPDWVADEVPVALEYNGISHAVMLATPLDLDDFALGFSLSEGILDDPAQLYDVVQRSSDEGIIVAVEIASSAFARLKDRRRTLAGRTGCGLCGTENLSQVARPLPLLAHAAGSITAAAIARGMAQSAEGQALQQRTGAVHAAAWCEPSGAPQLLREDVGRHNALDKLVGALARAPHIRPGSGFITVTSRASFEMVQKTALARVPLLAAVSAPTALAVRIADSAGLTLVGFARGSDYVVYSHPGRIATVC